MIRNNVYVDLKGRGYPLGDLSDEERQLIADLQERAQKSPDWNEFDTFWMRLVANFYDTRKRTRKESRKSTVYRIAQDLSSRLAIAAGLARPPDYRDELADLIRTRFKTRRAFCEVTGLSEDMLSHVLAHRKHLSMDALTDVLSKVGYFVHIAPLTPAEAATEIGPHEPVPA